jgi:hypothetical protein
VNEDYHEAFDCIPQDGAHCFKALKGRQLLSLLSRTVLVVGELGFDESAVLPTFSYLVVTLRRKIIWSLPLYLISINPLFLS